MLAGQMVALLVGLLALSILTRGTSLFLLSLALLVAALLSRLWEHYCLVGVEYRRRFSQGRASFGQEVYLDVEIVNRKLLPLSWLEVEDEIPQGLPPRKGRVVPCYKPERSRMASLLAMRPYERVRRRYTIPCTKRGEHLFGPVRIRSGDLFGFAVCERELAIEEWLVVYPRVVPLARLGLPAFQPLGELKTQSWLFEDVSRIAGAREHRPGDGLRRIHWPASVRTQRLQTRLYEPTTSHKLAIFLNLDTKEGGWDPGYDPEVLELSITTAASLAQWGLEQGYQVGVFTNGVHREGHNRVMVQAGGGPAQLERILLALARLQSIVLQGFDSLLAQDGRRLPFGTTLVLVTPSLSRPVLGAAIAFRKGGHAVTAIVTGRQGVAQPIEGITVRRVGPPEAWRNMSVLAPA